MTPVDPALLLSAASEPSSERARLASIGLVGPSSLSEATQPLLSSLIHHASAAPQKRNLHTRSLLARRVITDAAIRQKVADLVGVGFRLWRTNFFQRLPGQAHPGVGWHHDKHFQSGNAPINYDELGDHISIVIGLDLINSESGSFQFIPGSHLASISGFERDTRPFEARPLQDHFLNLPPRLEQQAQEIVIPAGSFCLFHSALLHGSAPSDGTLARTSMVGRLVRDGCEVPADCASDADVIPFC